MSINVSSYSFFLLSSISTLYASLIRTNVSLEEGPQTSGWFYLHKLIILLIKVKKIIW